MNKLIEAHCRYADETGSRKPAVGRRAPRPVIRRRAAPDHLGYRRCRLGDDNAQLVCRYKPSDVGSPGRAMRQAKSIAHHWAVTAGRRTPVLLAHGLKS